MEAPGDIGEARVRKLLEERGHRIIRNIMFRGMSAPTVQIDLAVDLGARIGVIESKNYAGTVVGSAAESEWTQWRQPGEWRKFPSPIRQVSAQARELTKVFGVAAVGIVCFAGSATFPEIPGSTVSLAELGDLLEKLRTRGAVPDGVWSKMENSTGEINPRLTRKHNRRLDRKHGRMTPGFACCEMDAF